MNVDTLQQRFLLQRQGLAIHFFIPKSVCFHFCSKPLVELERSTLADLTHDVPAKGTYMLLRTLDDPITCSGTMLLVEDHTGKAFICFLYEHVRLSAAENELPSGTVFILKEPCLKATTGPDSIVVVGSPSDFAKVDRNHVLFREAELLTWVKWTSGCDETEPETAMQWREKGNSYFKMGKYDAAIEAYLTGADMCKDAKTNMILGLNLSAAYLLTERYENAIRHASNVLKVDPDNEKALFRMGRAYYELGSYNRAKHCYECLIRTHPSNRNARLELRRCRERLKESVGQVDTCKLHRASLDSSDSSIDFGCYVGSLRVASLSGKGRGVVANCDMAPGTLILAEKALSANWTASNGAGTQGITKLLIQAFLKNPKFIGDAVFDLSSNDSDRDSQRDVIMDFSVKNGQPVVDYQRFLGVVNTNSFSLDDGFEALSSKRALFRFASYFNHSCVPNSSYEIYNDVIAVRTLTEISAEEEITISYISNTESFHRRMDMLAPHGFKCSCVLCESDRDNSEEIHQRREILLEYMKRELTSSLQKGADLDYDKLAGCVGQMKGTYERTGALKVQLFNLYLLFAQALEKRGTEGRQDFFGAIDGGLNCVGLSVDCLINWATGRLLSLPKNSLVCKLLFQYTSVCARAELCYGRPEEVDKWVRVLLCLEQLFTGGDLTVLQDRFRNSTLMTMLLRNAHC